MHIKLPGCSVAFKINIIRTEKTGLCKIVGLTVICGHTAILRYILDARQIIKTYIRIPHSLRGFCLKSSS